MKRLILLACAALLAVGCGKDRPKDIPQWNVDDPSAESRPSDDPSAAPGASDDPSAEVSEDPSRGIPDYTDMVLVYGYSHHRKPYAWTRDIMKDYVLYQDTEGAWHWLFDAFLCLEFMSVDGPDGNKTFITGYKHNGSYLESAAKEDWEKLLDYYCQANTGIGAIDAAVAEGAASLGEPARKRQIILCVPEPIPYRYNNYGENQSGGTTYWGELDGKQLDFSKTADRVKALKWYIDTAVEKFAARRYKNVELGGFYITAERATYITDILKPLGEYIRGKDYSFNWIPYYKADGYHNWQAYGFTHAFMQPNYFFSEDIAKSRLVDACETVLRYQMGMEIEFDGKAMASNGWGYRLRDYMKYAQDYGVWEKCRLAYYQGSWALRWLKDSSSEEDRQLYHDFCRFVTTRPIRETLE